MYIEWVNHPYKPELNGTREHVARSLGEVACGYGQAKLAPRPNYGTPEWIKERQDAAAKAVPHFGDVNPIVQGVEWGVKEKARGSLFSKVSIIKRVGFETTFFSTPPADCPPAIVARFRELTGKVEKAVDRVQEQYKQDAQVAEEKVGVLGIIFGTRK